MIEFTMSRVCMGICGLILMSAVFVPSMDMFENEENERMDEISHDIADTIERFIRSNAQTVTISLRDILPDSSSLSFRGNIVCLEKDGRDHISAVNADMGNGMFTKNDILVLKKENGRINVSSIS